MSLKIRGRPGRPSPARRRRESVSAADVEDGIAAPNAPVREHAVADGVEPLEHLVQRVRISAMPAVKESHRDH